ncbi:MAG: tripartite tricarboxylate transporter substrate-binding protein, partial [Burkholderiales bacterium]
GTVVRAGTPRAVVERLNNEFAKALQLPEVKEAFSKQGLTIGNMTADQYDAYIRVEMARNEKVLRKLNLKVN